MNSYARKYRALGFRSGALYRNQAWYRALEFSYDMSVPSVAHLDPQRGGCCTVFPFFIGDIVELPLTTLQDYPIYNILRSNPLEMWTRQMDIIVGKHGLVIFLIHPDYMMGQERQTLYAELLAAIERFRTQKNLWLALPGEVDTWWRQRNNMELSQVEGKWTIQGDGSERAAIAYARLENGAVTIVTDWKP